VATRGRVLAIGERFRSKRHPSGGDHSGPSNRLKLIRRRRSFLPAAAMVLIVRAALSGGVCSVARHVLE
jgi:hypothetical protein